MFWEKNLARVFAKKKEIIPVNRIVVRIRMRILFERCGRICWSATAAPVLVLEIA